MNDAADLPERLLVAARKAGAEAADALVIAGREVSVAVRDRALEEAEGSESADFGLRVLIGRRQACVSSSDASDAVIAELAERAVAMAKAAPEDPYCGLADPSDLADPGNLPDLDLIDPADPPAPETLRAWAEAVEAGAMEVDGVSQVESAAAGWGRREIAYAATNGFSGAYARTATTLSASAVAGAGLGMETDYHFAQRVVAADLPPPEEIGAKAGARAVARLNPGKAKTGAFPVLFDERVAGSLIGHVLSAINGAAVARGASWLRNAMGEIVLPEAMTLSDDPLRPRHPSSRPFDGEGMALSRRDLIEAGRLRGWLMDAATARQLGLPAPGGARRGTGAPPSPGHSTLRLKSTAARPRDELVREIGEGLIVTSLIGSSVNQNTGAYSRGASGFWVSGGEIAHPVNELTVAGSLPDFMTRLTAADDADETKGLIVPSLLVEGLTVAAG